MGLSLLTELRRRNVIRVAGLYIVSAWLLVQIAETLLPIFHTPDWVLQTLVVLLALGFIPALVTSWVFELTPEGLRRDSGSGEAVASPHTARRLDLAVIALLLVTLAVFAWGRWFPPVPVGDESSNQAEASRPGAALGARSIAVLPFENFSATSEEAFFADGLADTVLHRLAQLPELTVIARNSSFSYKGSNVDVRKVGAELGVATVLEGSVQRAGDRLRVIAQLIETTGGTHLWSQTYDRTLDDIFAIQDDIATAVAAALQGELIGAQTAVLTDAGTDDPQALALFLQATEVRQASGDGVSDGMRQLERERDLLLQALARDPHYLAAWVRLVRAHTGMVFWSRTEAETEAQLANAQRALQQAMQLNPSAPAVREAWVWVLYREGRTEQALTLGLGLLEHDPNNVDLQRVVAINLSRSLRQEEALALLDRSVLLDPHNSGFKRLRAIVLVELGRHQEARRLLLDRLQDETLLAAIDLWRLDAWVLGQWDDGLRTLLQIPDAQPAWVNVLEMLPSQAALLGMQDRADALLRQHDLQQSSPGDRATARRRMLMARGDAPGALASLRAVPPDDRASQSSPDPHLHALLQWLSGDEPAARASLDAGLASSIEPFTGGVVLTSDEALKPLAVYGLLALRLGNVEQGERMLRAVLARLQAQPMMGDFFFRDAARAYGEAEVLAALGEREAALDALEAALPEDGEAVHLLSLTEGYIGDSPFLTSLHDAPRYQATMAEIERRRLQMAEHTGPLFDALLARPHGAPAGEGR